WMSDDGSGLMWVDERAPPFASRAMPAARGHRHPVPNLPGHLLLAAHVTTAEKAGATPHSDITLRACSDEAARIAGLRGPDVGAAGRRRHLTATAMVISPRLVVGGMLVDGDGQRFINEEVYPGLYCHAAVHPRPGPVWVIVDEQGIDEVPESELWGMRPMHAAETIEELAEDCGLPADALADPLRRAHAGAGV